MRRQAPQHHEVPASHQEEVRGTICWETVVDFSDNVWNTNRLYHRGGVRDPWRMYHGDDAMMNDERGSESTLPLRPGPVDPIDQLHALDTSSARALSGTETHEGNATTKPQKAQTSVGIVVKLGWIVALAGARAAGLRRSHLGDRIAEIRARTSTNDEIMEVERTEAQAWARPQQRGEPRGHRAFNDPTESKRTALTTTMLVLRMPSGWRSTALK